MVLTIQKWPQQKVYPVTIIMRNLPSTLDNTFSLIDIKKGKMMIQLTLRTRVTAYLRT